MVENGDDHLQFAYASNRSTEDAILTLLHTVCDHLEKQASYARILFIDFSSAFNTIQPHLLLSKLIKYKVNAALIRWIFSFLTQRTQRVRVGNTLSDAVTTNTGAPQGCVLSPALFTLYTADCRSENASTPLIKFADDTSLSGLILQNDESVYRNAVEELVAWCDTNHLELNVSKTKELVVDFRKKSSRIDPIVIKNEPVEIVKSYKYLGTFIDNQLDWSENVDAICKKANQKLFFLRKLKQFQLKPQILRLFFQSAIQSILAFNQLCYYSSAKKVDIDRLDKIVARASSIIGIELKSPGAQFPGVAIRKLCKIRMDDHHPLHPVIAACESARELSQRMRSYRSRTNRLRNSFVPTAIRLYNKSLGCMKAHL